jgi:hypothetical protein
MKQNKSQGKDNVSINWVIAITSSSSSSSSSSVDFRNNDMGFFETSAKERINVEDICIAIAYEIDRKSKPRPISYYK